MQKAVSFYSANFSRKFCTRQRSAIDRPLLNLEVSAVAFRFHCQGRIDTKHVNVL